MKFLLFAQEHGGASEHGSGLAGPLWEFNAHDAVLVYSTLIVIAIILGSAAIARSQMGTVPKGMGAVFEHIFDWLDGISQGFMGREGRNYVPLAMSFFLFILISNWMGLLPIPSVRMHDHRLPLFESPSASFNTTLALAILSFLAFNLLGLKKRIFPPHDAHAHEHSHEHGHEHTHAHDHGVLEAHLQPGAHTGGVVGLWQWISHFWAPTPTLWKTMEGSLKYILVPLLFVLFLVLNFVEEWARIMSLSLRLYGNIFGEHMARGELIDASFKFLTSGDLLMMAASVMLLGIAIFITVLGALAGFVQAMVFTMLTLSYIAHAVADEH